MKAPAALLLIAAAAIAQTQEGKNPAPWQTVSVLPAPSAAVIGLPYRWTGAATAFVCPTTTGGSGGTAIAGCITLDGINWTALFATPGSLNQPIQPSSVVVSNAGGANTSYLNPQGSGNRTNQFTCVAYGFETDCTALFNGSGYNGWMPFFDGSCVSSNPLPSNDFTPAVVDFGTPRIITEITYVVNRNVPTCNLIVQGTNAGDNISWTTLSPSIPMTDTMVFNMSGNTTAYRHYRVAGDFGTVPAAYSASWNSIMNFKIDAGSAALVVSSGNSLLSGHLAGTGLGPTIACTVSGTTFISGSDWGFQFSEPTGSGPDVCTVTFANQFQNTPACSLQNLGNGVGGALWSYTVSTSHLVLTSPDGTPGPTWVAFCSGN